MNTKRLTHTALIDTVLFRKLLAIVPVGAFYLILGIKCATGAQLLWDPLNNGGSTSASGNWNTTIDNTVWYNDGSDVVWSQTGTTTPTQGAVFNGPDAVPGTYVVTLDAGQIVVTNLAINASGYAFTGANTIYLGANDFLNVAPGKTVDFNCNLGGSGTAPCWVLGSGATMNVSGNLTSGQQVRLAGPVDSAFNLTGGNNVPAIMFILAPVNLTTGSLIPNASFYIGYGQTLPNNIAYSAGTLTISGASTFTVNGNILIIGRNGGDGILNLNDGTATIGNTTDNRNVAINYDGSTNSQGTVNVSGGTLNVGSSIHTGNRIDFFQTGATLGATATMNLTGGTVNTWGGIIFGAASGTFSGGSATFTQSGGSLYIGPNGIVVGDNYTAANAFSMTFSGGTVGALANWSSSLPMTLGATNGNITFQCADNNGTSFNISLSGALTGDSGLNVSGGGTLTLGGANNYSGDTVISNGTLAIVTGPVPSAYGPVTVDASTGSPTLATTVSIPGQYWTNNGAISFLNGATTLSFQFGSLSPSASMAPAQVNGDLVFSATPAVNVDGTTIAVGTYPLIKYTGAVSGTMPTSANLPGYVSSGYLTNITVSKTIALVVTDSTYHPGLYWQVGNGVWDIETTANWTQFGDAIKYTDGDAVIFDDSASGTSPITVTLNTTVNPLSITAANGAKNYVVTGTGAIAGSGSLQVVGGGTITLNTTNTYSGGTVVSAGQLNINNGGDVVNGTPVGQGTLTLNSGAALDNTSGSDVTLQAAIQETWNGNFSYVGSANDLNTGPGQVTMNGSVSIAVSNHTFTVGGSISESGGGFQLFQLSKTGNGTLTLPVANFFSGGLTLSSGQLNLGDPGAIGYGVLSIYGGAIDNISGTTLSLSPLSYFWSGSFSFLGTDNLDLGSAQVLIPFLPGGITLNVVSNTLITGGYIVNNNTVITKTGNGIWEMGGPGSGVQSLGLIVAAGQVNLHKSGQAIVSGNSFGLTVQTNGLVLDENNYQIHSGTAVPIPVALSGGTWDLNGFNENLDKLSLSSGGRLRNSATASTSTLQLISGYAATLAGENCQFDVTDADGVLNFNGAISGAGSLVKTGAGLLNLNTNNTYTGNTTVSVGTLALSYPSLASASTVTIARNAILQLNFDATNTVSALILNGVSQPAGLYNATNTPVYLAGAGSLEVVPLPVAPTNITVSVTAGNLLLSWPSNYVGWLLQSNSIGLTATDAWFSVPGSTATNQMTITPDATKTNVFYRLFYQP